MGPTAAESNAGAQDTEALYREHGAAVASLCRSLLRDRAEAEDAAQQVFLSVHRALLNGAAPREPLAWLLAVARHECYARFRQRAVAAVPAGEPPDDTTPDASVHVLRAGELATVWDEVGRMPPAQREAFLLREIRGLSYGQLAAELSLSRPSVRSLLLRARSRLRRRLGDVAAGLGGAPWVQALVRLLAGGDAGSPVPAATKAVAVGVGALALAGGGGLVARHASTSPSHADARHRAQAQVRHVAAPAVPRATESGDRSAAVERPIRREDGSRGSSSGRTGSHDAGDGHGTSSGDGTSGSGHDGPDDTATVAQPTTDGHDGSGSSSSGPGSAGGSGSTSGSGSGSGSDGDSGSTTTTVTSSGSDGSDGSGSSDSGSSDGGSGSSFDG